MPSSAKVSETFCAISCKVKGEIIIVMRIELRLTKKVLKTVKYAPTGYIWNGCEFRIPDSWFLIPDSTFHKLFKNMADSKFTFHRLLSLLRWVRTIATWKTVIESIQSLEKGNFRVAFTRFLAFYSDNPSGLRDGETSAKWPSKASFATHPSTETEWPPKLLTRFSSWRIELHSDM